VKTIRDATGTSDAEVLHEVDMMKKLHHPNIVSIIGACVEGGGGGGGMSSSSSLSYQGGSSCHIMRTGKRGLIIEEPRRPPSLCIYATAAFWLSYMPRSLPAVSRGLESLDPTRDESIFLLLEFMDLGDLHTYLYVPRPWV
jgi:serine/threonine protein kinase